MRKYNLEQVLAEASNWLYAAVILLGEKDAD